MNVDFLWKVIYPMCYRRRNVAYTHHLYFASKRLKLVLFNDFIT